MVKLTIELDEDEVKKATKGEFDEVRFWQKIRDYTKSKNITEPSNGVFEKDGEDAMCQLILILIQVLKLDEKQHLLKYFNKLELNVDGEIEDCKQSIIEGY